MTCPTYSSNALGVESTFTEEQTFQSVFLGTQASHTFAFSATKSQKPVLNLLESVSNVEIENSDNFFRITY